MYQLPADCAYACVNVQHLVASVASQGRFPVATGLSLCLYLNCAPEAGKESSGSLGLFLAFAAGVAAVPPPSPDGFEEGTSPVPSCWPFGGGEQPPCPPAKKSVGPARSNESDLLQQQRSPPLPSIDELVQRDGSP